MSFGHCSGCGAEAREAADFCGNCGKSVRIKAVKKPGRISFYFSSLFAITGLAAAVYGLLLGFPLFMVAGVPVMIFGMLGMGESA